MGLKKILKQLSGFLDDTNSDTLESHCAEIAELLEKLRKKQSKLGEKLDKTDKGSKRKSLKLDLKLTEAELKKGEQLFREKCSDLEQPAESPPEAAPAEAQTTTEAGETNTEEQK